jgi:hypothetical protein
LNEETGLVVGAISKEDRIFLFENKEYTGEDGVDVRRRILGLPQMGVSREDCVRLQEELGKDEEGRRAMDGVLWESQYYFQIINSILRYLGSVVVGVPKQFEATRFRREVFHVFNDFGEKLESNKED